jgi:hypothetical protein
MVYLIIPNLLLAVILGSYEKTKGKGKSRRLFIKTLIDIPLYFIRDLPFKIMNIKTAHNLTEEDTLKWKREVKKHYSRFISSKQAGIAIQSFLNPMTDTILTKNECPKIYSMLDKEQMTEYLESIFNENRERYIFIQLLFEFYATKQDLLDFEMTTPRTTFNIEERVGMIENRLYQIETNMATSDKKLDAILKHLKNQS